MKRRFPDPPPEVDPLGRRPILACAVDLGEVGCPATRRCEPPRSAGRRCCSLPGFARETKALTDRRHAQRPVPGQPASRINRTFYDGLWGGAGLVAPERFNTWPWVDAAAVRAPRRLEVGPGLRPRLPVPGTRFVDISPPALSALAAHGGQSCAARLEQLPFPDASFDLLCALDVIEHVADDVRALAELVRVAAPRALLLISVPLHPSAWTRFDELVGHQRRYEPDRLAGLLGCHGLRVEQSAPFGMRPRSSRLVALGMWFLRWQPRLALWTYDRMLTPFALRRQPPLRLVPGMLDASRVDEVLLVCRAPDERDPD